MLKAKSLAGSLSLLFLLNFIHPCNGNAGDKTVLVFQDGKTEVQYPVKDGQTTTKKPIAFTAPSFVGGMINDKEFLAIISSTRLADASSENDYIDGVVRTRYGANAQLTDAAIFKTLSKTGDSQAPWGDTTAVMKENKIYVLITDMEDERSTGTLHDPLMIIGTVKNREASGSIEVYIEWGEATSLKDTVPESVRETRGSHFIGGKGNGVVTTNGTIIFPIVMVKGSEKFASTLYSIDNGQTWLIGGETEENTNEGSLVEWSKEKLLFVAASQEGFRKVFESTDLGITWKRSPIFFAVWGNNKNHQGQKTPGSVVTVPVDAENVFLFAYPLNKVEKQNNFDTLQLWLSDGQRITCVGTISDEKKEENTGHSVLAYVGKNLYVTHQINPSGISTGNTDITKAEWNKVIGLTLLTDAFANVKTTVLAWRKLDEGYNTKGIPVDGLVGFLGNTKADDKVWVDMYNCVNATVTGGEKVDGGFKFNAGMGSGAKWPVVSQGQNQLYKFTESQFTFAAKVTPHSTIKTEGVFLLGASGDTDGNDVLIGLGYTKEMKWYLIHESNKKTNTDVDVELGKEYHVVITVANKVVSVYVDDMEITNGAITLTNELSISHFFMGGTGVSSAPTNDKLCTVKNVMLFSRALDNSEIEKLTKVQDVNEMKEEITEESKVLVPQTPAENSRVTPSRDTDGHKLTPGTKTTIAQGNHKTSSPTKSTSTTENIQSMQRKEEKEASGITPEKATNEGDHDKKINNALQGNGDAVLKKDAKGDNGAALSLSAVAWICFVCSLIALMGF